MAEIKCEGGEERELATDGCGREEEGREEAELDYCHRSSRRQENQQRRPRRAASQQLSVVNREIPASSMQAASPDDGFTSTTTA
jgi:hypothetical protein